jgi:hypothetical protein
MRCLSRRALLLLVFVAALSGCSGSGSSGQPSAGSYGGVSPGTASSQSESLASQTPPTGRVGGHVLFVGGPAPGLPRVLKHGGTVTFTGVLTFSTPVHTHGAFSAHLSPGTYKVTATSPDDDGGRAVCAARRPVRTTEGSSASVKVYCQIR